MTTPRARILVLALLALAAATPASADRIIVPPVPEVLVEGHTVYAVIEPTDAAAAAAPEPPTASAAPAEAGDATAAVLRKNGVLWFNHQYLLPQDLYYGRGSGDVFHGAVAVLVRGPGEDGSLRYPCGGAVMAVPADDGDPRVAVLAHDEGHEPAWLRVDPRTIYISSDTLPLQDPRALTLGRGPGFEPLARSASYEESYLVTDPNDHVWIIDKYVRYVRVDGPWLYEISSSPVWVVNLFGGPVFVPDDGVSDCGPAGVAGERLVYRDASPAGTAESAARPTRLYNALLVLDFADNDERWRSRDHATATSLDTNGCQVGTEWACPGGDDDMEGDSHKFRPAAALPPQWTCPFGDGTQPLHGGSAAADWPGERTCDTVHATRLIDLYYAPDARPMPPLMRSWALLDTRGSDAQFGPHE